MSLKLRSIVAVALVLSAISSDALAEKGKMGHFGVGAFGGFHRSKQATWLNQINAGGRFLLIPHRMVGLSADFSYYFKKSGQTIMQPKLGLNIIIPTSGAFVPYIGGNGSYNIIKVSALGVSSTSKKFGFGGQIGAHILFGGKASLFLEGQFEYILTAVSKTKSFGGIAGLMIHF